MNIDCRQPALPYYGDGLYSQNFTYVDNACVGQHQCALSDTGNSPKRSVQRGCRRTQEPIETMEYLSGICRGPSMAPNGPAMSSTAADISKAMKYLDYKPSVSVKEGLQKAFAWYQHHKTKTPQNHKTTKPN